MDFKRYRFTVSFGLIAAVLCLMNFLLFGNEIFFMYLISPPSWFIEIIQNMPIGIKLAVVYSTTILFWALAGLWADRIVERRRAKDPIS